VTAVIVIAVLAAAVTGALAWPRTRAETAWLAVFEEDEQ